MTIPPQFASLYDGQEVFVWSNCLLDLGTDFLIGNMVFVWDACHFHGLYSSLELCCEGAWFTSIRVAGSDNGAHQSYLGTERNTLVIPNWFQPCQCCCCLCYLGQHPGLGTLISYKWSQVLEACDSLRLLSIYFNLCVDATGVVGHQLNILSTDLHAGLWKLCRDTQLIVPVILLLLLGHQCHQQSRDWWLFCLQCWQCHHDLLRRLSWSFPIFNDCTAASTLWRMGWSSSVSVWGQSSTGDLIGLVVVQLSAVFCPLVQYLSFFCEAFSWTILDSSNFSLFHIGKVFHKLVSPLTVVLPQIFFNFTTLFSYPVFFCLFRASLDAVVHFLVCLRSFRFKSFFSPFSPFVTQIKNFSRDLGIFSWHCLPRISLAVSVTAVLKVVIIESRSVSLLFMMSDGTLNSKILSPLPFLLSENDGTCNGVSLSPLFPTSSACFSSPENDSTCNTNSVSLSHLSPTYTACVFLSWKWQYL